MALWMVFSFAVFTILLVVYPKNPRYPESTLL